MKKLFGLLLGIILLFSTMAEADFGFDNNLFRYLSLLEELESMDLSEETEWELFSIAASIDFDEVTDEDIAALEAIVDREKGRIAGSAAVSAGSATDAHMTATPGPLPAVPSAPPSSPAAERTPEPAAANAVSSPTPEPAPASTPENEAYNFDLVKSSRFYKVDRFSDTWTAQAVFSPLVEDGKLSFIVGLDSVNVKTNYPLWLLFRIRFEYRNEVIPITGVDIFVDDVRYTFSSVGHMPAAILGDDFSYISAGNVLRKMLSDLMNARKIEYRLYCTVNGAKMYISGDAERGRFIDLAEMARLLENSHAWSLMDEETLKKYDESTKAVRIAPENTSAAAATPVPAAPVSDRTDAAEGQAPRKPDTFSPSMGLKYWENKDGTCTVAGIGTCTDSDLVIPLVNERGFTVIGIDSYAFTDLRTVTSLTIQPGSDIDIGPGAFRGNKKLTAVYLWDSTVSFDTSAFSGARLKTLTAGGCDLIIGDYAFNKSDIESITIADCELEIGSSAFRDCDELTAVAIVNTKAEIGSSAFTSCSSLESVTLQGSTVEIGDYAFNKSSVRSLTVTAEQSIEIGSSSFRNCDHLATLAITAQSVRIGTSAFSGCTGLRQASIGQGEIRIDDYGFNGCDALEELSLSQSNQNTGTKITLESSSFRNCSALERVMIGCGKVKLGTSAFSGCECLHTFSMGQGTLKYDSYAFHHCSPGLAVTVNGVQQSLKQR